MHAKVELRSWPERRPLGRVWERKGWGGRGRQLDWGKDYAYEYHLIVHTDNPLPQDVCRSVLDIENSWQVPSDSNLKDVIQL